MNQLTDQDRHAIVQDFLRSGLGQEAYCEQLARERGLRIAPRTLRSWLARLGRAADPGDEARRIIERAIQQLQNLLKGQLLPPTGDSGSQLAAAIKPPPHGAQTSADYRASPNNQVPSGTQLAAAPASAPRRRQLTWA